jgi:hypothetical protein
LISNSHPYTLGYKLRQQISKSIARRSTALRNALARYNELAPEQDPPRPIIKYKELLNYASLGEFDLLRHLRHTIIEKPWTKPINHEATTKHFKVLCARKEIERLNIEIRRLQDWVDSEDDMLAAAICTVSAQDPLIGKELEALRVKRFRINEVHRSRLCVIYQLDGYNGPIGAMRGHYRKMAPQSPQPAPVTVHNLGECVGIEPSEDDDLDNDATNLEDIITGYTV